MAALVPTGRGLAGEDGQLLPRDPLTRLIEARLGIEAALRQILRPLQLPPGEPHQAPLLAQRRPVLAIALAFKLELGANVRYLGLPPAERQTRVAWVEDDEHRTGLDQLAFDRAHLDDAGLDGGGEPRQAGRLDAAEERKRGSPRRGVDGGDQCRPGLLRHARSRRLEAALDQPPDIRRLRPR